MYFKLKGKVKISIPSKLNLNKIFTLDALIHFLYQKSIFNESIYGFDMKKSPFYKLVLIWGVLW